MRLTVGKLAGIIGTFSAYALALMVLAVLFATERFLANRWEIGIAYLAVVVFISIVGAIAILAEKRESARNARKVGTHRSTGRAVEGAAASEHVKGKV